MEKRINTKVVANMMSFKSGLRDMITEKICSCGDENTKKDFENLLQYVYDFETCEISKDDLTKRKRVKNVVPPNDRCCAYRANNEQCSRRKRNGEHFCGTHIKGTPHGVINESNSTPTTEKIHLTVQEIQGIHYYIDEELNVYKHEDILQNTPNPTIIAKCVKNGDKYSIPELST